MTRSHYLAILCLTISMFEFVSTTTSAETCMLAFKDSTDDLNPYRFQGYWYATKSYWGGRPWLGGSEEAMDVQTFYLYRPGHPSVWDIALGVSWSDDKCHRRRFNISVSNGASRTLRDAAYYHHILDTDYLNYAIVLFCYNVKADGFCDYRDIQTVLFSRMPSGLQGEQVWPMVIKKVKVCAPLNKLQTIRQTKKCVCSLDDFQVGTGDKCK